MGLDMYLHKRTYVKNWAHSDTKYDVTVLQNNEPLAHIKPERVKYVTEEVMYWRKANAIHNWFVKNCQNGVDDCRTAHVSRDDLIELINLIDEIFDEENSEERDAMAMSLLPPTGGFFFGSTDLDEWYYQDLEYTREELQKILDESEDEGYVDFEYGSSW